MFNQQQNKRLTALAYYIDQEIESVNTQLSSSEVRKDSWKKSHYLDIRAMLFEAANAVRDARDIADHAPGSTTINSNGVV